MLALAWAPLAAILLAAGQAASDQEIEVKALDFAGVKHRDESQLRAVLVTRSSGWLPWADKKIFDQRTLDADLKRIVAFSSDRGYRSARVVSQNLTPTDDHGVRILVTVEEGDPTLVERVDLEGFEVLGDLAADLPGQLQIKTGRPLDIAEIQAARERAIN